MIRKLLKQKPKRSFASDLTEFSTFYREERDVLKRQISGKTEEVHKQKLVTLSIILVVLVDNNLLEQEVKDGVLWYYFQSGDIEAECNITEVEN